MNTTTYLFLRIVKVLLIQIVVTRTGGTRTAFLASLASSRIALLESSARGLISRGREVLLFLRIHIRESARVVGLAGVLSVV